jgi:hypothetical protein
MRKFAFETKRTFLVITILRILAIIWYVIVLIWWSSKIRRAMSKDAVGPIMLYIFLRAICCFITIHIKILLRKLIF